MAKAVRLSAVSCAVVAIALLGVSAGLAAETAHGQKFRGPQASPTAPTAPVIPPGRATISGAGAARTGTGAAKLGGPASANSGINGTTLRRKH
jgi:hypothetical protein